MSSTQWPCPASTMTSSHEGRCYNVGQGRSSSWRPLASANVCRIMFIFFMGIMGVSGLLIMTQTTPRAHPLSSQSRTLRWLSSMPLRLPRHVEMVTTGVIPPIPDQGGKHITLKEQFHPRFAAREFLLGASTMCRLFPILMAASLMMTLVRLTYIKSLPVSAIGVAQRIQVNPPHMLDVTLKLVVSNLFNIPLHSTVFVTLISPIIEEISYRGFGHWLGALGTQWDLCFFCLLCCWTSPAIAVVWKMFGEVLAIAQRPLSQSLPRMVINACQLPAIVAIYRVFRDNARMLERVNADDVDETSGISENRSGATTLCEKQKSCRIGPLDHNAIIERALTKKNCTEDSMESIRPIADRSISWNARWVGALFFGRAHLGTAHIDLDLSKGLGAQKCVGTIVSSLIVESRLAIKRRTLWGAIGAHVTYNSLSSILPLLQVMNGCLEWYRHEAGPTAFDHCLIFVMVATTFFMHGLLLYYVATLLERLQARLAHS